mmetsp:Transcript_86266/g.217089  ORF Transcript_86266/g.217089 Transcript_86266/m.217089 type:complete len:693 (-) Transcript_86266:122-2200(-)
MSGLLEPRAQAARPFAEPLRPGDRTWRGRNGALRDDLGPLLPLVRVLYPDGTPAIERQEDGSGFVLYPSGHKAVCFVHYHRSRRVGAIVYADRAFPIQSFVPLEQQLTSRSATMADDDAGQGLRQSRTKHLGAFDEWGIGSLQTLPDATGAVGLYQVSKTNVTVVQLDGRRVVAPRASSSIMAANAKELVLKLSPELTVSYDIASKTTLLDFVANTVQQSFNVGEIWRGGQAAAHSKTTTPAAVFDAVAMESQGSLELSCFTMNSKISDLHKTLKIPTGTSRSMAHSLSSFASRSSPSLSDTAKSMCEGRHTYNFEHLLRKKLAKSNLPLDSTPIRKSLKEGFRYPRAPVGKPPLWPQKVLQPVSLKAVSSRQIGELMAELESQSVLLVVLVVASWATGSKHSSSEHARAVCEAANGEFQHQGEGEKLMFCVTEAAEAGSIHSERRWTNSLVKQYGIKSVPWMLMFARGKVVSSENPTPDGFIDDSLLAKLKCENPYERACGLGSSSKLRYMAFAKPRVLVLEPAPTDFGGPGGLSTSLSGQLVPVSSNVFKLQLETQDALKRAGFSFDLAVSLSEARRMAADAEPPYGMLIASSEVGSQPFAELAARLKMRCPRALSFICHNRKELGELDESMHTMVNKKDLCAGVFERPLTKSRLERALVSCEAVRVKYPECGLTKDILIQLIQRRLAEV